MERKRCSFVVCCNYSEVLFFLHLLLHTHEVVPDRAVGRGGTGDAHRMVRRESIGGSVSRRWRAKRALY